MSEAKRPDTETELLGEEDEGAQKSWLMVSDSTVLADAFASKANEEARDEHSFSGQTAKVASTGPTSNQAKWA
ncbi:MAG TPA: hypothetical protein VH540_09350 [Ktedonobacterales bacterium]|jgi:hypothetical protein